MENRLYFPHFLPKKANYYENKQVIHEASKGDEERQDCGTKAWSKPLQCAPDRSATASPQANSSFDPLKACYPTISTKEWCITLTL